MPKEEPQGTQGAPRGELAQGGARECPSGTQGGEQEVLEVPREAPNGLQSGSRDRAIGNPGSPQKGLRDYPGEPNPAQVSPRGPGTPQDGSQGVPRGAEETQGGAQGKHEGTP